MKSLDEEKEGSPIKVTCTNCGHTSEILLPQEKRRATNKLVCSKCAAKGSALRVEYLRDQKAMY